MIKYRDKQFNLKKITYIDHKLLEMDRVLTMLFPRLKFNGYSSRRTSRRTDLSIEDFLSEFRKHDEMIVSIASAILEDPEKVAEFDRQGILDPEWFPEIDKKTLFVLEELLSDVRHDSSQLEVWFRGIHTDQRYLEVMRKWIETDLMDVVNRGASDQAIAAPRPLHGNTYKFRNANHTRDYGAADQIYWMIFHARRGRGQATRDNLKRFFFPGIDMVTDRYDPRVAVDVETQALLHLDQQVKSDIRDNKEPERYPPLCIGQADIMADDLIRLLAYQNHIPRSVLVDYIKIILAFHLALYQLRLFVLLPAWVSRQAADPICDPQKCPINPQNFGNAHGNCPYQIGLVVEMQDPQNQEMQRLSQISADQHYRRIPQYIQSHFVVAKLDEFAENLNKRNRLAKPAEGYFSVGELLDLLGSHHSEERIAYFKFRLSGLIEKVSEDSELDPEIKRILELGLDDYESFIEVIVEMRSKFHRQYITECLDSLFLKNTDGGLLRQSKTRGSPRYFSMGSRLLEVLLQIAVLVPDGVSFYTREVSIEELLQFLRNRYGIYIDQMPENDSFGETNILFQQGLRKNLSAFKNRLREIGFFQDLSDAYITQTITPRYSIAKQK